MPSILRGLTARGVRGLWGPTEEKQSTAVQGGRVPGFGRGPDSSYFNPPNNSFIHDGVCSFLREGGRKGEREGPSFQFSSLFKRRLTQELLLIVPPPHI